jgi:alkylation response protein AidB-like acyl-CoA dehydrogenase
MDLTERAKRVGALASEHADYGDKNGRLAEPVVEALHREGLLAMWVPKAVNGAELDPVSSLEVLENVSYGDPSAGWVLMAASLAIGTGAAYLGDAAVKQLFAGKRLPVIAGQGTRPGTAVPEKNGFRLSGSWSFASGIKHGTHIHTLGIIQGTGEPRIFVLPVEQVQLIDNWDVMGLRATGSIDYKIDNVFVPDEYTHFAITETPKRGGSAGTQSTSESFLEGYAAAEGTYRAARAFVYETWRDVRATLERGEPLSIRQHTLIRLGIPQMNWAAHEVAAFVYKSAGTTGLRAGTIQRLFRDMNAGTQHVVASPPVYRAIGRELAGLALGQKWRFLDLVDAKS